MIKERTQKIIDFYSHDYRDMKMAEGDLKDVFNAIVETMECEHNCRSDCRREGCNCVCGEYHL